jgi:hypothetical protein
MQLWMLNEREYWILNDISLYYFITDIHFIFHNVFIFWAMNILDSDGKLYFCQCILIVFIL